MNSYWRGSRYHNSSPSTWMEWDIYWKGCHQPSIKRYGRVKLENNTYLYKDTDDSYYIKLHWTRILTWTTTGRMIIQTGGWSDSQLTHQRLSYYSGYPCGRAYNNAYINIPDLGTFDLVDGMEIIPFFGLVMVDGKVPEAVDMDEERKRYRRELYKKNKDLKR